MPRSRSGSSVASSIFDGEEGGEGGVGSRSVLAAVAAPPPLSSPPAVLVADGGDDDGANEAAPLLPAAAPPAPAAGLSLLPVPGAGALLQAGERAASPAAAAAHVAEAVVSADRHDQHHHDHHHHHHQHKTLIKTIIEYLRYFYSLLTPSNVTSFLFAVIASIALGFITMTAFTSLPMFAGLSVGWGIAVFLAAALVEGDVYISGVKGAIEKLIFKGMFWTRISHWVKRALTKAEIRAAFEIDSDAQDTVKKEQKKLQRDMLAFIKKIKILTVETGASEYGLSLGDIEKLKNAKKATQCVAILLAKIPVRFVSKGDVTDEDFKNATPEEKDLLKKLIDLRKKINSKYNARYWLTWVSLIAALGTGVAFAAITYTHMAAALLSWVAAGAILSSAIPVWILPFSGIVAFFAGTAYFLMMYNMLAKAAVSDSFIKFFTKLKTFFVPKKAFKDSTRSEIAMHLLRCFFRLVIIAGIIALSTVVTMATADAWLLSSQQFFAMLGGTYNAIPLYASVIGYFLVWVLFVPVTTLFAIENSDKSLRELWTGLKKKGQEGISKLWKPLVVRFKKDNILQLLNPFRWVAIVCNELGKIVLIIHGMVSGIVPASGEQGTTIPGAPGSFMRMSDVGAGIGAVISEVMVDATFVAGMEDQHDHSHHDHSHKKEFENDFNKDAGGGHNHNGGITTSLVWAIALIPNVLSFIWDNLAGQLNGSKYTYGWSVNGYNEYLSGKRYESSADYGKVSTNDSDDSDDDVLSVRSRGVSDAADGLAGRRMSREDGVPASPAHGVSSAPVVLAS